MPGGAPGSALAATAGSVYRSGEVVQILGISRRQLQYWAHTNLVPPSVRTKGGHHRYTFRDLVALKATKRLLDAGASVQRIRRSIQALRGTLPNVEQPLVELVLVATGDILLVLREGTAFEAVSGQEWVFPVVQLQHEIDAWKHSSAQAEAPRRQSASGRRSTRGAV